MKHKLLSILRSHTAVCTLLTLSPSLIDSFSFWPTLILVCPPDIPWRGRKTRRIHILYSMRFSHERFHLFEAFKINLSFSHSLGLIWFIFLRVRIINQIPAVFVSLVWEQPKFSTDGEKSTVSALNTWKISLVLLGTIPLACKRKELLELRSGCLTLTESWCHFHQ